MEFINKRITVFGDSIGKGITTNKGKIETLPTCAIKLFEEFEKLGVDVSVVRLDEYPAIISDGKISIDFSADFFVYLDKDKYVLTMLEKSGAKVFNNARAIQTCDDKMSTYIALSDSGVPMPKTLPGILCYNQNEKIKERTVEKIEKELAYPLIVKESYGSLGKRVYLVKNREELLITLETVKTKPHLLQEFVEESRGRDLRVIVGTSRLWLQTDMLLLLPTVEDYQVSVVNGTNRFPVIGQDSV